ncbi:MAG TPA: glycosyltransferase [Gemmatales bacterium]|nr:glycosyltransferase [Gemmatales bacterium]
MATDSKLETEKQTFSKPLHVVHVTLSLDYGGLERVVLHLVKQAVALGQKASILCLERPGALAERAEALGVRVYCIDKQPGLRFDTIKAVRKVFDQLKPDVVHTHQIGALFYSGPAARQANVPVIVHTEHGKTIKGMKQKLLGWWAARYAERFYCVSADIEAALAGFMVNKNKMEVLSNGINTAQLAEPVDTITLRRTWNIAPDAVVLGTIARLAPVKRQDLMLHAFAKVCQKVPGAVLLLVGDGDERSKLEALAAQLGVIDRVRFTGLQAEPGKFLHLMSAFLLTSESEGMPLSLLEAWAVGVPVVTFRVGGLSELVRHGETGYLADFGEVNQLADHIVRLIEHPKEAQAVANRCRDEVRHRFDVATMARAYDTRYRELFVRSQH